MGVISECISSTVTISEKKSQAALDAIKNGVGSRELGLCSTLGQALDTLNFEFTDE